eukprot:TRINITY_DN50790_c0_g1_i1.p1 TRINITY_DN50790_c0_g1~~TRINITY_DN50790_c0_g1_i1.p1  ORF type:complete len:318 (-),score=41.98 TRINITY_DN50790_c0_g1_i1:361-1314(-)
MESNSLILKFDSPRAAASDDCAKRPNAHPCRRDVGCCRVMADGNAHQLPRSLHAAVTIHGSVSAVRCRWRRRAIGLAVPALALMLVSSADVPVKAEATDPSNRIGEVNGDAEVEWELDDTDAHLAYHERRMRMTVCMEIVKEYARENPREISLTVEQMSDRLSEYDAKNYIFHSLLVNCYHSVDQAEVEAFGAFEMASDRVRIILSALPDKPHLKLSASQLEILNSLLREDGAVDREVELVGMRFSELGGGQRAVVFVAAGSLCVVTVVVIAARLLCPDYVSCFCGSSRGSREQRRQARLEQRRSVKTTSSGTSRRR